MSIIVSQDANNVLTMTINPCEIQSDPTTGLIASFDIAFAPIQNILCLIYSKYQQLYPIIIKTDGTICMSGTYIGSMFCTDICQIYTWKNPIAKNNFNLIDNILFLDE